MTRFVFFFLFLVSSIPICSAKDNYEISMPVGLDEVGINKVLCMKNGYTLLFHFQINKTIKVKVFDAQHKRVANTESSCDYFDVSRLTTAMFKGLFEVNGEAVLFFEQQNGGRHSLIRLRYNGTSGKLVDETQVGKAKGLNKPLQFFVMKDKKEDGYAILFSQDVLQFRESENHVSFYNAKHEVYNDIVLDPDRKKYDYMSVVSAESRPEGVCITFGMSNLLVNGTGGTMESMARYNNFLYVYYIPRGSKQAVARIADLSTELTPYYASFTHNAFAGTINLLMLSYRELIYRYGIDLRPSALVANLLFCFDEQTLSGNYTWLNNKLANSLLAEKTDTSASYTGLPVKMITNENGLSTVVSESYKRYQNTEGFAPSLIPTTSTGLNGVGRFNQNIAYPRSQGFETYLGNLCITQFDDSGKEVWGTVLPKSQYYRSYRHYYRPQDIAKKWQDQPMFDDTPPQILERQFMSTSVQNVGDDLYIIFNDGTRNLNNTIEAPGDTVYASTLSNACYYKMNKKKEITKHFLLGDPLEKEYKSCYIEGADFDAERKEFASLIRYKRGAYVSIRMAWVKME
jgi:hypothetical protein